MAMSASEDKSTVLWKVSKEKMLDKIELNDVPNYLECLSENQFIICDTSKNVKIFKYKD
jgi:hypothetical protein